MDLKQKIKDAFAKRERQHIIDSKMKSSAVLIPIFLQEGNYYILFTKRTELMKYHKGEISFPGGGYHKDDETLVVTALRESFEEIGLKAGDAEIIGELDDIATSTSNYIISPFVAFIPSPYHFKLNTVETDELLVVPLKVLLEKGGLHPDPGRLVVGKSITPFYYSFEGKIIKGATARILQQFLEIVAPLLSADTDIR